MKPGPHRAALPACLAAVGAMAAFACSPEVETGAEPASAGTISYEEIVTKYADPDSRFVVLEGNDGINVHYKDEDRAPRSCWCTVRRAISRTTTSGWTF